MFFLTWLKVIIMLTFYMCKLHIHDTACIGHMHSNLLVPQCYVLQHSPLLVCS